MPPYWVYAQIADKTAGDVLAGGAGWFGAGLLGAVLSWLLLKHLPEKDRQSKEKDDLILKVVTNCNEEMKEMMDKFGEQLEGTRKDFAEQLRITRVEAKQALEFLMKQHDAHIAALTAAIQHDRHQA